MQHEDSDERSEFHRPDGLTLAHFAAIVESSEDAIISKDLNGVITSWNHAAEQMFGYKAEEMIGQPVQRLIPDDRREEEPRILERLRRGERICHFETVRRRKNGSTIQISLTVSPVKDGTGRIVGASKIARDITQAKETERQLAAIRDELAGDAAGLERLYDLSAKLIHAQDLSALLGDVLDSGLAMAKAEIGYVQLVDAQSGRLKVMAHRMLGDEFLARFSEAAPEVGCCGVALQTQQRVIVEDVRDHGLFAEPWCQPLLIKAGVRAVHSTPILSRTGKPLGMFSVYYRDSYLPTDHELRFIDILVRQAAETIERLQDAEALRESERQLRELVAALPTAVYTTDAAGKIRHYNQAAVDLWGCRPELGVTQWCGSWRLYWPDGTPIPLDQCPMALSLKQNRPVRGMEAVVERPDGIRVPVLPYPTPLRDASGKLVGGVNMLVEISDRKQAEKQLRQLAADSERRVTERTQELVCSQERLRALASDLTLTEQRERRRLATELHDYLAQLVVASRLRVSQAIPKIQDPTLSASLTTVDQMLDQALTYTRSLVAELSPHILYRFGLAKSLVWLGDQMKQHSLDVTVKTGDSSFTLPDDQAVLLFQSVRELLLNIVKHAGTAQAEITINVDECNELWICVEDNGVGFEPAAISSSEDSHSKFGLLSIRERMELLGGECEISSTPGAGTLAILRLPLSQNAVGAVAATHPFSSNVHTIASGHSGRSVRVLLVDDHAMVRQGLRSILDSYADLNVVGEAADGQDAVIMSRSLHPDVVVMDVNLPLLDGIEATRIMCREHEAITIIGISVRNDPQVKLAMSEAGAAAFLPKESAASQLYEVILNHCPVKS
ncbi:MAG: hypothetical protein K0S45_1839 [Nitrospira sp.]|jgi:PAS domain S-box-containing protein|nr:hypothetical protein [Nitrospira sp.]